jgi:hypothetical protein
MKTNFTNTTTDNTFKWEDNFSRRGVVCEDVIHD